MGKNVGEEEHGRSVEELSQKQDKQIKRCQRVYSEHKMSQCEWQDQNMAVQISWKL
jgi:hypothetical protein